MSKELLLGDINEVFSSLDLPLIDKGIEEIELAKEKFSSEKHDLSHQEFTPHKVILTNGTGSSYKSENKYAELERGSIRN